MYNNPYKVELLSSRARGTMNILTFSEARAGREAVMDDVCNDHSPTIITRQGGEAVVMLSLADFNSIELHWNEKPESWQPM